MMQIKIGQHFSPIPSSMDREIAKIVLVGIVDAIKDGGYKQGCRNNMAVDFSIACYCLGIDARLVAYELPLSHMECLDFEHRTHNIDPYLPTWDDEAACLNKSIWDKALCLDMWKAEYDTHVVHALQPVQGASNVFQSV